MTGRFKKYGNGCRRGISKTAYGYLSFYKDTVHEMTKHDRAERRTAEQRLSEINEDVRQMRAFIDEIENI